MASFGGFLFELVQSMIAQAICSTIREIVLCVIRSQDGLKHFLTYRAWKIFLGRFLFWRRSPPLQEPPWIVHQHGVDLLLCDIDHFKKINDTYGHQTGDVVLKKLAEILRKTFPRKTDFVARYGGEEFTVIFSEDDAKVGTLLGKRICDVVRKSSFQTAEGKDIEVTISVGVAEKQSEETIDEWVKRADQALYRAKESGRDRVSVG